MTVLFFAVAEKLPILLSRSHPFGYYKGYFIKLLENLKHLLEFPKKSNIKI
jgi:hypothetical protein